MTRRMCTAAWLASAGLVGPVFACPAVVPCIPSACYDMRHPIAPARSSASTSTQATSLNISLLSQLPLSQMGGGSGSSLYGWVDPLNGREYAIMGRSNGTAFIDISNPSQPKYVANLPRQSGVGATTWTEPKVYGNHVYVGVDGTNMPLQVMDLTRLRNYAGTTMQLSADSTYAGGVGSLAVSKVHTLGINPDSGYLYLAGTRSETTPGSLNPAVGLHIVDVRNPASPTFAGAYTGDDYTHETQVITYQGPDLAWRGREIALNSNGKQGGRTDTFSIVDVTNKSAPAQIAAKTYANARYIHQGWITEDHKYFFQNDELDETGGVTGGRTRTHLWDIRDLDNPIYKGFYDHTTASIDHNLYVKGSYLYETNYTTGLRILKIGDLVSSTPSQWLTEVAYYDTYQPNDGSTFSGAWNSYPFFPSGNVAISDINGGLFVVRPQLPADGPIGHSLKKDPFGGSNTAPLPEPGTAALLAGLLAAAGMRRRR